MGRLIKSDLVWSGVGGRLWVDRRRNLSAETLSEVNSSMEVEHRDVVDYWSAREDDCGLGATWADADRLCWRCGRKAKLQQCHIVPKARGGACEPSNLVLLCNQCHREAPNVSDPRYMWIWLRATSDAFYEVFCFRRAMDQYVAMFGKAPFEGVDAAAAPAEEVKSLFRQMLCGAVKHFGEGHLNPVTVACVIHQVEQVLQAKATSDVDQTRGQSMRS
jgi:5-methylcytosine-specific restriction endonuclease McrA